MVKSLIAGLLLASLGSLAAQIPTGPAVGQPLPDFRARDQHGKVRTFQDLTGPNGLLFLFHRSADW